MFGFEWNGGTWYAIQLHLRTMMDVQVDRVLKTIRVVYSHLFDRVRLKRITLNLFCFLGVCSLDMSIKIRWIHMRFRLLCRLLLYQQLPFQTPASESCFIPLFPFLPTSACLLSLFILERFHFRLILIRLFACWWRNGRRVADWAIRRSVTCRWDGPVDC